MGKGEAGEEWKLGCWLLCKQHPQAAASAKIFSRESSLPLPFWKEAGHRCVNKLS